MAINAAPSATGLSKYRADKREGGLMDEQKLTWQFVEKWANQKPEAEAIVFEKQRVTYAQFRDAVDDTARAFLDAGVKRGDRVAMIAMARPEFLFTFMAANKVGAMWLGVSPKFTLQEFRYIIDDCQPSVLIALREYLGRDLAPEIEALAREFPSIKKILVIGEAPEGFENFNDFVSTPRPHQEAALQARIAELSPDDNALLLYTSGSSGKPKGVVHTHRSILSYVTVQREHMMMTEEIRCLLHFPINHVAAATEIGYACVFAGGACVMTDRFDAAQTLKIVEEERITLFGQVPAMFLLEFGLPAFPETDFSSVTNFMWGGSTAPKLVLDVVAGLAKRNGARMMTGYGATEMCGFVTYSAPEDTLDTLFTTVGKTAPPFEVKIVDADRLEVARGEIGEIAVRGETIMKEYWNKPDQTEAVLDADGWYYSGDLAKMDERGYITISGRKSEMYKTGGENVFPREVEDVIEKFPGILMAAVIGVRHEMFDEVGYAFVMPHPGQKPAVDALHAHCRENLANFKVPKTIEVRPMLPLLPNGKVNKMALRSELSD
ncbi:MAG: AMP-binding protein [Candidatus Hydrogenedentes bacterium]|nr:AMP-binding protein [Candidatus Hydrogenedentota bacterium]